MTIPLQRAMAQVGIPSFRALCQLAGLSQWPLQQLRRGQVRSLRLDTILRFSQVLDLSVTDFLTLFEPSLEPDRPSTSAPLPGERSDYDRLTAQLAECRETAYQEFQAESLQVLEPWLLQWATAVAAAQRHPDLPASRLIPLVQPVETLMQQWGLTAIAPIGAEVPFDPQQHELLTGAAAIGAMVRIRYAGYRHGDRLLYRAKVSPVEG